MGNRIPKSCGRKSRLSRRFKREKKENPDVIYITEALSDVSERYHIVKKELGHGHFGVVRKCKSRQTGEWFAIKSIHKTRVSKIDVLRREIDILRKVHHPNIIGLIEVFEDVKYLHLITELCTGGELFDRIIQKTQSEEGHFSEYDACKLVNSILDAIQYCHDLNIVHRDLKPENFLFASDDADAPIKIIDFGLSRSDVSPNSIMNTKVGTPYYVAPEVLRRKYTSSCDIWSIGVITYILLCGYPPFYGDSDKQIFESVRTGFFDFPSPDWDEISNEAKDFVCSLLKSNPEERLSAEQARRHPWIRKHIQGVGKPPKDMMIPIRHVVRRRSQLFQSYMGMIKIKKTAVELITSNMSPTDVERFGVMLQKADMNNTCNITLDELYKILAVERFPAQIHERLDILKEELSLSGDEILNWKEFLAAIMGKSSIIIKEDKILEVFENFKQSDNGVLDVSYILEILGQESSKILDLTDVGERITYNDFKNKIMITNF